MTRAPLLVVLCASLTAHAWSTRVCSTNSSLQPTYPGGAVWPLQYLSNMPAGSSGRVGVASAMQTWNSVVGAYDNLSAPSGGYGFCTKGDNAGVSVIGWDDGTCHAWGASEVGVTVVWTQSCSIVKEVVYFNSGYPFSTVEFEATALHELGHYQNAAHDWYELSIMGYSDTDFTYLTAADHSFLRGVWGSGTSTLPDLYLNRIVASSPIVPDQRSMTESAPPTCSGSCTDLRAGDTIRVQLSYGNAGSTAAGPFDLEMRLGTHVIGAWTQPSFSAHAQSTYWFTATVPAGIPPGTYALSVEIDPAGVIAQSNGPTSGEVVSFTGFAVRAPAGWTCSAARYNALDGCDCNCGVADPDCTPTTPVARGCGDANTCTDDRCSATGQCVYPTNTATCEDGLYCTTSDRCAAGACTAGSARDCSALSNACNLGVCDEPQRACVRSPRNEGGTCDDGLYCTVNDACASGTCTGTARDCSSLNTACATGTCNESLDRCVATAINQGQSCDDGLRCTTGDSCASGTCTGTAVDCSSLNTPCTRGECDPATGACRSVPLANGTTCEDGLYCTTGDACAAGSCVAGPARDCSAQSNACNLGVCDETANVCARAPRNEGGACDDGLFCTTGDRCTAGTCGGAPRDCSASSSACAAGTCDEGTDRCVASPANQGQSCDDGLRCTTGDVCTTGSCTGAPLDCSSLDTACTRGQCDPATGGCLAVPLTNGTACNDGRYCTVGETCTAGVCGGGQARSCASLDSTCAVGACDEAAGACRANPRNEGSACNDGRYCTENDTCVAGTCTGALRDCSSLSGACTRGTCDDTTQRCRATPANEGQDCDDGAFCTTGDRCTAGACVGSPRSCAQLTTGCALGVCDEAADACASQPQREGQPCDDGQRCLVGEVCRAGACQPGQPLDCSALDAPCVVGTCDALTGACAAVPVPEGTACDDHAACTTGDVCREGVCAGTTLDCSQLNDACHYGRCDERTGQCAVFGQVGPCEAPSGCGCGVGPRSSVAWAALGLLLLRARRRYC
ncbi:MAG: hypothetical protein ACOZQL_26210 [Myxococcota bacterium]